MDFEPMRPTVNRAFTFKSCTVVRYSGSLRPVIGEEPSCPVHTTMYIYKMRQMISIKIMNSFV
jgi:hypothetical protein